MKYDAVIIGSGLGGLECANILARAGMSVLVLERGQQIGGCLQSYKRNGLSLDTGFHYVGGLDEGQSLHKAFDYLGLLALPWHRLAPDGFDRVMVGGRTFAHAQGFDAFVDRLAADFPRERKGLEQYAALLGQIDRHQFDALRPGADGFFPHPELFEKSAYGYLTETFRDPLLIDVLSGTSLKMELRKESLPLFTFLHGNSSFIESGWRLRGDGGMIAAALADGARRQGCVIRCKAEVTELVEEDGRLTRAICADGEAYEGEVFISDVHPALTCRMIKRSEKMRKAFCNRMQRIGNTFGMFTVSLLVKPNSLEYINNNWFVYDHPGIWELRHGDRPTAEVMLSCRVPEDGSGHARQIDLLTPMRWDECRAWEGTRPGRRGDDYEAMKQRLADECVSLAERAVPGLRDVIVDCYTSTPLTYRDYTLTPEGSAYGMRKDFHQPLTTMHSPRTPIPNLLLTGQNLILHGMHGVTMTALFTCACLLGKEWIWNIIKD